MSAHAAVGSGTRRRGFAGVAAVGVAAWVLLWNASWQPWAAGWPWLRVAVSLLLFSAPGAAAVRLLSRTASPAAYAVLGFSASIAVAGLLGLAASLAGFSAASVATAFFAVGLALLCAAALRGPPAPVAKRRGRAAALLACLPAVAGALLLARLCLVPGITDTDDYTYLAHVTKFLHAGALGFDEWMLGLGKTMPPRMWLAFWPLSEALLARNADMSGVELVSVYLPPVLALLSMLAVFHLARSLGLSIALAALAVVAHAASLMLLTGSDQAGRMFFLRLAQDKVFAAAFLAPAFFASVAAFLARASGRRLALAALCGTALSFTHPTALGIACAIAAVYAVLDLLCTRRGRAAAAVVCLLVAVCLPQASLRFAGGPGGRRPQFSMQAARRRGEIPEYKRRRLNVLENGRLVGFNPKIARGAPFAVLWLAAAIALFSLRRRRAARLVVAAALVVASALVPYTGWILAFAITPFHLWRVPWQAPFGIAAAFCAHALASTAARLRRRGQAKGEGERTETVPPAAAVALLVLLQCLLLAGVSAVAARREGSPFLPLPKEWRTVAYTAATRRFGGLPPGQLRSWLGCLPTYGDLRAVGGELDRRIAGRAVVLGDVVLDNLVPALSSKAVVISHRGAYRRVMALGGLDEQAAVRRTEDAKALTGPRLSGAVRLHGLRAYAVEYLVLCGDPAWMPPLREPRGPVSLVYQSGDVRLYRVQSEPPGAPDGPRGARTDPVRD